MIMKQDLTSVFLFFPRSWTARRICAEMQTRYRGHYWCFSSASTNEVYLGAHISEAGQ